MALDVAISIITYNHEKFIGKTIESIIDQKTDYNFKLFITDDNSTDNTASICESYERKYPLLISFESFEKNIGVIPNWMKNYQKCIKSRATYIANCDGDDYWTDPLKLQKQITFLNENHDYALTFSDTMLVDYNNREMSLTPYFTERKKMYKSGDIFWDLLKSNFINNSSICLRTNCITDFFPQSNREEKRKWYIVDYWLWLHIAKDHKVHFFDEVFAIYRTHEENLTSGNSGFFSKRPPYIMIDVISTIKTKKVEPKNRILITKILMTILIKKKSSLITKMKAGYYMLKFPPSFSLLKYSLNKQPGY